MLAMGTDRTPGRAASECSTLQDAEGQQPEEAVPFIVETGGWINDQRRAGLAWLNAGAAAADSRTGKQSVHDDDDLIASSDSLSLNAHVCVFSRCY